MARSPACCVGTLTEQFGDRTVSIMLDKVSVQVSQHPRPHRQRRGTGEDRRRRRLDRVPLQRPVRHHDRQRGRSRHHSRRHRQRRARSPRRHRAGQRSSTTTSSIASARNSPARPCACSCDRITTVEAASVTCGSTRAASPISAATARRRHDRGALRPRRQQLAAGELRARPERRHAAVDVLAGG